MLTSIHRLRRATQCTHPIRRSAVVTATLLAFLSSSAAQADLFTYLTLTIDGQVVTGGVTQSGREGTIQTAAFSMPGFSPVSAAGVAGPAQSRPVTATLSVDQATPLLFQAWANGGVIDSAVFRLYRPTQTGQEENYMTVTLTNGRIAGVALTSPDTNDVALISRPTTVHVTFTYATATWDFEVGGPSVTRPWQDGQ